MPVSTFRANQDARVRFHLSQALEPFAHVFHHVWTSPDDGYDYLEVRHPVDDDALVRAVLLQSGVPVQMHVGDGWLPLRLKLPDVQIRRVTERGRHASEVQRERRGSLARRAGRSVAP